MAIRRLTPILTLAALLPAQEREQPGATEVLRVQTGDRDLLLALASLCDAKPPAEPLPAGGSWLLVLRSDQTMALQATTAPMREGAHTEAALLPPAALALWREEVAALQRTWGPRLDVIAREIGFAQGSGRAAMTAVSDLLPQIAGVRLRLEGDPRRPEAGVTLRVWLTATPESALHGWLQGLQPAPQPPRELPAEDPALVLRCGLAADAVAAAMAPFAPVLAALHARDQAERDAQAADWQQGLRAWDGTLVLALTPAGLRGALGARDPELARKRLVDPVRFERERAQAALRRTDLTFTPGALEHRGVTVLRTLAETDLPTAGLPAALSSWSAVAGDCMVLLGGDAEAAAVRAAIDAALDGALRRPALPDHALLAIDADLERLAAMAGGERGDPAAVAAGPLAGRRARLTLHRVGVTLELRCEVR